MPRSSASDRPRRPADRPRPPSVERVLAAARLRLDGRTDPVALLAVARAVVDEERGRLDAGATPASIEDLAAETMGRLAGFAAPLQSRVINATGVIIHTNLGRATWPDAAIRAAIDAAGSYVLLEMDRATGRRGARARDAEDHLVALTGGEDALVTNNNAAAVALAVGLFKRRGIAVSRGELVEIGGGVRIPEIVRRAGARLVEVGTTNRTRSGDFEGPLAGGTAAAVLRVHPSNFAMTGFTELPDARELADLAHTHGAVVIDDLGSGALLDTADFGLRHEPTPSERLAAGSDLVTFSGDKLVGGPQAGLIVGRGDLIARMRRDPLARAMRPDKVSMAAIAATLAVYRSGRAAAEIPVWRMISTPMSELHARAAGLAAALVDDDAVDIVEVRSTVGGGSLPGETLPSVGLTVGGGSPDRLLATLRRGEPPVIARIEDGRVVLDLRSVDLADLEVLGRAIAAARAGGPAGRV